MNAKTPSNDPARIFIQISVLAANLGKVGLVLGFNLSNNFYWIFPIKASISAVASFIFKFVI